MEVLDKETVFDVKGVSKAYMSSTVSEAAIKEISIKFYKSEFVAITGKSGSGKSTLLNLLAGLDKVSYGEILFKNRNICQMNEALLTKWRGRSIGIIFQFFQLIPTLTVIENIILPMDFLSKLSNNEKRKRASSLLSMTGIDLLADKFPFDLSGGEQQRVAIVRAMANDPDIFFADEPTGNLDSATSQNIMDIFLSLAKQGKTILMVTHNNDMALQADRIVTLHDGCVISDTYNDWKELE